MNEIRLLQPPLALAIMLMAAAVLSFGLSRLACRGKSPSAEAKMPYACGEDLADHMAQPDYGQFLPFAFFFTILHVIALMGATVPVETVGSFAIAAVYMGGAAWGLFVLYAR